MVAVEAALLFFVPVTEIDLASTEALAATNFLSLFMFILSQAETAPSPPIHVTDAV